MLLFTNNYFIYLQKKVKDWKKNSQVQSVLYSPRHIINMSFFHNRNKTIVPSDSQSFIIVNKKKLTIIFFCLALFYFYFTPNKKKPNKKLQPKIDYNCQSTPTGILYKS